MLKLLKIIIGIWALFLLFVLVETSFFSADKTNDYNLEFLSKTENINIEDSWSIHKDFFISGINFFDNIYFTNKESFNVNESGNNIDISLKKWIFIFDLNDLTKKYTLSWSWFNIDLKTIWNIYIDTTKNKVLIFSINSSFLLDFLDKQNKKVNSYFMYPHEYINFMAFSDSITKDIDLLRMKQLLKPNWYFKYPFNDILDSQKVYANLKLVSIIWKSNTKLFNYYIKNKHFILEHNNQLSSKISELKNAEFPFKKYIDKYSYYFINDSKKLVYIENTIYNNLIQLFNENKLDKPLVEKINNDLETLKSLNNDNYNNTKKIIDGIYKVLCLKNNVWNDKKIENFTLLKNKWINNSNIKNYLLLKNIYFNYDFTNLVNLHKYFNDFLSWYLINSWIVEKNENLTLNKKEKLWEIESFVFFLNEYIKSNLFIKEGNNLNDDINILSKYIWLNKMIYFSDLNNSVKIRTSILQTQDILYNIDKYLWYTYFKDYKNNDKLLVLKNQQFDLQSILNLEKEIKKIFSLFSENIDIIRSEGGDDLIKKYTNLNKSINNKFLALTDYSSYKYANNEKFKKLYWTSSIWEKNTKKYSVWDINSYLSSFNWISFDIWNITKVDSYFEIKDVIINWEKYNFNLYPHLWNKLDVYNPLNGDLVSSYDLDYFKKLLIDKLKWAKEEDKYKYDFTNFLSEKFKKIKYKSNNDWVDVCNLDWRVSDWKWWCKYPVSDNDFITVFKRDKLIGEEFSVIKDFFDINYNNLAVEKLSNWDYKIEIKNAVASITLKENKINKNYKIILYSDYDLEKHLFKNIKIQVINKSNKDDYLFNWAYINIKLKTIKILELKSFLEWYSIKLNNLENIVSLLSWAFNINNLNIESISWNFYLKFENNKKEIKMTLKGTNITSISKDWISILTESINIADLSEYLDKLK